MACSRGKANPNPHTKLLLFADSGGYCQNPNCNVGLFFDLKETSFHIAEMAHIISAGEDGPRKKGVSQEEKGNFQNLILLCPSCHTTIDKAEKDYPVELLKEWKQRHSDKIKKLFEIKEVESRIDAHKLVLPYFDENKAIFENYGPQNENNMNPESEAPLLWIDKVHKYILPNNRKILNIIEVNYSLLNEDERVTFNIFKQHILDLENRHLNNVVIDGQQFPSEITQIFT
ncbi:HNH endonuclease [Chryseobacterium sp. AG363]|uniref:HNH endonuclease n=1 Tax=Chryseobacterium sp. AG363 TaxID=2183997 RepID=UPI000E709706|nr:hypothetical protein [Chryseobacterium sp. AG363]RKE77871.1 hypothetical protein DEU39_3504 [Chryseobacterium sp. AG363]